MAPHSISPPEDIPHIPVIAKVLSPAPKGKTTPPPGQIVPHVPRREQPRPFIDDRATWRESSSIDHEVVDVEWPQHVDVDRVIESVWAILLSWYRDDHDIVFDIAPSASPTSPTARVGVTVERDLTLTALQHQIALSKQTESADSHRIESDVGRAWSQRSILIVQSAGDADEALLGDQSIESQTYAIKLRCESADSSVRMRLAFDPKALSEQNARRLLDQFDHILRQICHADMASTKVRDLDAMMAQDLRQVWTWNATAPEEAGGCVHDLLAESVARYPQKTAINAWDGELLYSEWDTLSTRLAHRIIDQGVRPGNVILLIFEKSMWVPVAQFAVMKAGAASVVVDPSQPKERIKAILDVAGPGLILCGQSQTSLVSSITDQQPFVVQKETILRDRPGQESDGSSRAGLPAVKPSDLLYVVFTSGTTGTPKGAAITHSNFTSAIKHQNEFLKFTPEARVAGFCSYAFDVSWSDTLHALAAGACLCIPSEHDRKHDFIGYMIRNEVTFIHLTPSLAAILDLDQVPTLDTVTLSGELVDFDKLPQLRNIATTLVTYGPAECTVTGTGLVNGGRMTKSTIGRALGSSTWVADPDKDALMPVGMIGELLLEGPLVGAGYLNNPEKTASAFLEDPSWLLRGGGGVEGRRGRLYRTGDLVRYTSDGELIYLGRKDTQVKINGQRTELGEVEHHLCRILNSVPVVADVVAEVVTPKVFQRPTLIAFLRMPTIRPEELAREAAPIIAMLEREMPGQTLPHMIPSLYIPMTDLPRGLTGKTDRKALREIGSQLDRKALASLGSSMPAERVEPSTEAEIRLRDHWASVLKLPAGEIGAQDDFLHLGGESIAAIRLVADLRKKGIRLTVSDVYSKPRLRDMAQLMSRSEKEVADSIPPFSLLKAEIDKDAACRQVAELCSIGSSYVESSQVEDIFPCTALQEGLLAMTARSMGKYIGHRVAELKPDVDIARLQKAWRKVSEKASVLRTRIVDLPGQGLVQVVLKNTIPWQTFSSLNKYHQSKETTGQDESRDAVDERIMGLGTPLTHLAFIIDEATARRYMTLTHHHATYDGWSVPLLLKDVEKAYEDDHAELSSLPLQPFVRYVMEQHNGDSAAFWEEQFAGIEMSPFPALPSKTYQPKPDKIINHQIRSATWPACGVTPSSVLRTAWATLISWYVDSPDVTFGAVVSGRQASVPGIENVAGPTIATVPVRVLVRGAVDELLQQVQRHAMGMIPFEQYGLQHIRKISPDAEHACGFQTLLLVHSSFGDSTVDSPSFEVALDNEGDSGSENMYAMMLTCQISGSKVDLQLSFDSAVIQEEAAVRLLQQLEHILDQIASVDGATDISNLSRVSERDLVDIWTWNAAVPESVEDCVHKVFAQRVAERPHAPAVCAWDGELTYAQLDRLSTLLADRLGGPEFAISTGSIVPLCFEKSICMPVAVLAVMKAGAASVALDVTLPHARLKSIVGQLSPSVMLTSKSCTELAAQLTDVPTIEVDNDWSRLERPFGSRPIPKLPTVRPSSALYIVFTSGSTGAPKGATITHANFCSAIRHHQPDLGFERSSRVFDYTSYAFDVAWSNILHTLTVGGCLCIPSEHDRTADLHGSINRLNANFIHLTPTVGRLLNPATLPGLKKVLFIGEALKASDVIQWKASDTEIYNTYGPAECTITSTVEIVRHTRPEVGIGDPSIGKGTGALPWVAQPRAPDRLAAIGTIGELWLEGPIVGGGYLNNPQKTSEAFVKDPKWLLDGIPGCVPGRHGQLYRTGDLVYYNPDGSLQFVGRKDTQVKINGQRMELGEVEYHIRQLLPISEVPQIIVEVITPDAIGNQMLAVFLVMPNNDGAEVELHVESTPMISTLRKELSKLLPSYMVPGAYVSIPVAKLPMTATGKTDRKRVRELGKVWRPLAPSSSDASPLDAELNPTEAALRDIWARLLGIESDAIAPGHSFTELGGCSIKTMSLAMVIQKEFDVSIGVPRLVQPPNSLRELAALIDDMSGGEAVDDPTQPTPGDLEREIDSLVSKIKSGWSTPTRSTVFLTGATGFLGSQILRPILMKRSFDRVVLLVRGLDEEEGLERVVKAAQIAGWWEESFASTMEIWEGDLSADRLGLSDSQWSALCGRPSEHGTVEAIIHNGARVHWTTNYDELKDVNVGSTTQLLQAAVASPFLKSFVYISGGLITDSRTWTEEEAQMANGYDQTKYVSERLVSEVAAQFRNPRATLSVIKPGQLIGDVYTGVANADDFLWRVVMGAIRLGAHPVDPARSWLAVSDVRHVTDTILWHATGMSTEPFVHIKRGVWVRDFWAAVRDELQLPLRPVAWAEWTALAQDDMMRGPEPPEQHPLWPVQQFLGALGTDLHVTEHESYEWEMREVLAAARQNVRYLRGQGWLEPRGGGTMAHMAGEVMTRSTMIRSSKAVRA